MPNFFEGIKDELRARGLMKKKRPVYSFSQKDTSYAFTMEWTAVENQVPRRTLRVEAGAYFILKNWQTLSIVQTFKGSEKRVPICLQGLFFTGTELDNIMVFPEHAFILYKLDSPLITGYQNLSVYDIYNKLDSGEWVELNGKLDWSLESKKEGSFRDRGKTMERISR